MDTFFSFLRKTLVATIALVFTFAVVYIPQPPKADAVIGNIVPKPVIEVGPSGVANAATAAATVTNTTKDSILDGIAFQIVNVFLQQMLRSIAVWINSGFKGSPMFIQDFGRFMLNVADEAAGEYIKELGDVGSFICSPFRLDIQLALSLKYQRARTGKPDACKLSDIGNNIKDFYSANFERENFWKRWIKISSTPTKYTPYGQFMAAEAGLNARLVNAKGRELEIAKMGSGFLPKKICEAIEGPGTTPLGAQMNEEREEMLRNDAIKRQEDRDKFLKEIPRYDAEIPAPTGAMNTPARDSGLATSNSDSSVLQAAPTGLLAQAQATAPAGGSSSATKQRCVISTPGKFVEDQINDAFKTGKRRLEVADEINEIISALIGQIANQALIGTAGLLGLTPNTGYTSGGYGSGSYVDEMVREGYQSTGTYLGDGLVQIKDKLKVQQDYNALAVEYIPKLKAVVDRPISAFRGLGAEEIAEIKERALLSYNDAIEVRDTTNEDIATLKPLVTEFEALQKEMQSTTITDARKQEILSRQNAIVREGTQLQAYTIYRVRESSREWSEITRS